MPEQWFIDPVSARSVVGVLLLLFYAVSLALLLWRTRAQAQFTRRQWGVIVLLAAAGFGLGGLFPLWGARDSVLSHALAIGTPQTQLLLFSAVPLFVAAALYGTPAAVGVGIVTGLGRMVLAGDFFFMPLQLALGGALVALVLRQSYQGRFFDALRQPLISGPAIFFFLAFPAAAATFSLVPNSISTLAALDAALGAFYLNAIYLVIEGLAGGVAVLTFAYLKWYAPPAGARRHPWLHTIRGRIVTYYGGLVGVTLLLTLVVVPFFSVRVSRRLVSDQMAQDAHAVIAALPDFRAVRENALLQASRRPGLLGDDTVEQMATLEQAFRSGNFFRSLLLVDLEGYEVAAYPPESDLTLRELERARVVETRDTGLPTISPTQRGESEDFIISFIVPVLGPSGEPVRALVGRVPYASLNGLVAPLDGLIGRGVGYIVDDQAQIIAHPDDNMRHGKWEPPNGAGEATSEGKQTMDQDGVSNTRRMLYYVREDGGSDWTVVAEVPFAVVTKLAVDIALPLLGVLLGVFAVATPMVLVLGRDVTSPLSTLVDASRRMAGGELNRAVSLEREDEFGTLGRSFETMRRSIQKQVTGMEFLVEVTADLRTGFDLKETLPPILRNALRGTGAAAARAVLANVGNRPVIMSEGPAADTMAQLDRHILRLAQHAPEKLLFMPDEAALRDYLPPRLTGELPVKAAAILPLRYGGRYNGVLWLGFLQPHQLNSIERTLLDILAGRAAADVENARLYILAEGGRRRLAAVLSNIVDAVIVTDATERVLVLNPAMERAFNLGQDDLKQPLERVISDPALRQALKAGTERNRPVEVRAPDGRLFAAQVSDIRGVDGSGMGRVALLRDITQVKEMDRLRTHYLRDLSHDLSSPLTALQGFATLLRMDGPLNDPQREHLAQMDQSIDRVDEILLELLDKERIADGKMSIKPISLADLLPEVVYRMEKDTERSGLTLHTTLDPDIPMFAADRRMVRSAVVNLISNACKYAPNSGDLLLFAERDGDHVIIGLRDNGPGVEKDQQLAIFESFYRLDASRNVRGTGLGLSLVRTVARSHDGEAWCESKPGVGSTFYISLSLDLSASDMDGS